MTAIALALVVVWAVAGIVLVAGGPALLGAHVIAGSALGAIAVAMAQSDTSAAALVAWLVPGMVASLALALPDGRFGGASRALFAAALVVVAVVTGVVYFVAERIPSAVEIGGACAGVVLFVAPTVRRRAREVPLAERPRL